jgi:enamine deaminase RidA (YjgF/YER057c/UK114 family)
VALDNLEVIFHRADFSLADVVHMTIHSNVQALLAVYGQMVSRLPEARCRPTQTLFGVARLAFPELMVEIQDTAFK